MGAYGDGIHDDTQAIQNSINACLNIFLSNGTYNISDTITITPYSHILGASMNKTKIVNSNNNFTFQYQSEIKTVKYAKNDANLELGNFTCNCQNFLQLNQWNLTEEQWELQGTILPIHIHHIALNGNYTSLNDPNMDTNIIPTITELIPYGVGLCLSSVFDSVIEECRIHNFGIGIFLDGSDINTIQNNRFTHNGSHILTRRISTYGSQTLILHNDMLKGRRYGDIYLTTRNDTVNDNYFEDISYPGCAVYTYQTYGTNIINNRVDSPTHDAILFDLTNVSPARLYGTRISYNGSIVSIKNTYATYHQNMKGWLTLQSSNNDSRLVIPKTPGIQDLDNPYFTSQDGLCCNPLLLTITDTNFTGTGMDATEPFILDEDSHLYYFKRAAGDSASWFFQWRIKNTDPYLLCSKTKKIKGIEILYKSTRNKDFCVFKYGEVEYWRGYMNNLITDNKFHRYFIDLSSYDIVINNNSNSAQLEMAAYVDCKIFELKLVLEDYVEEVSI